MNYIKIYNSIMSNAQASKRVKGEHRYYERHHIIPRSLGGLDTSDNLVLLTAKEHFLAHFLIWKHYKSMNMTDQMNKMAHAFNMMSMNKNGKRYANTPASAHWFKTSVIVFIPVAIFYNL